MKRFFCALIILVLTISIAMTLNNKIINSSNEILQMIKSDTESEKIIKKWQSDKLIYSLVLPQTDVEKIQSSFDNITQNEEKAYQTIKEELDRIKTVLSVNFENIF